MIYPLDKMFARLERRLDEIARLLRSIDERQERSER